MAQTFENKTAECRAKVGLLSLRDCGRIPDAECTACGRPVCREHMCKTDAGVLCPECSSGQQKGEPTGHARQAFRRRRYYSHYGYHPYYYGHHHYYSDYDYRTFDNRDVAEHAATGAEAAAGAAAVAAGETADTGEDADLDFAES
jgi:hypothetical protein